MLLIAQRFGIHPHNVQYYAGKWGLKVDADAKQEHSFNRRLQVAKLPSDYKVNPTQFANVTTPEVAYLLGLLWADGSIHKNPLPNSCQTYVALALIRSDMETVRHVIEATGQWSWHNLVSKIPNRQPQLRAITYNKPLHDFLEKHDYKSKSSSPDKILSIIPAHLKHYWFRGLFDGDGHIRAASGRCISIASSYEQDWGYMENLCLQLGITTCQIVRSIHPKGDRDSRFLFGRVEDILRFCEYIYQGYETDKIGLPRKREKYETLIGRYTQSRPKPAYRLKEVVYDQRTKGREPQIIRLLPVPHGTS